MVEMKVLGVLLEPVTKTPIVYLGDKGEEIILPIGIGFFEANAIALKLTNAEPPRPLTWDLLKSILDSLDARVEKVLVHALKDNTYYAQITLDASGFMLEVDSRPSDAIALALRMGAPIYASEDVLAEAGKKIDKSQILKDDDSEENQIDFQQIHTKELDARAEIEKEIGVLRIRLKKFVEQEKYEEAAQIRDEISKLEEKKSMGN